MPSSACVLCMTLLSPRAAECHGCGLEVLFSGPRPRQVVAARQPKTRRSDRRRRLPPLVAGVVCVAGVGLSVMSVHAAFTPLQVDTPPAISATASDPAEAADWREGEEALRQALGNPSYDSFGDRFISVSVGHVVSVCGTTDPKVDPDGAERYVAVLGSPSMISLEFQDPSFPTLWERACSNGSVRS
jgi:hypothetical protein